MNLRRHLPLLLLVLSALVLRFLTLSGTLTGWWANVTPLLAVAFVGAFLVSGAWRWGLLAALVGIELACAGFGYPVIQLTVFACLAAAVLWGSRLRRSGKVSGVGLLGWLVGVSLAFYIVTNTASWLLAPEYAKTFGGWVQALTTGLPGFPPSWTFFRNSLLADLGFGGLLLVAHNLGLPREASRERLPWLPAARA